MAIDADEVLVAIGRTPNIEGLGLAEHGIAVSPKGCFVVDDRMRTTKACVYDAGDVTGRDQFVYVAAYGAKLAVRNALNGDSWRYDNTAMPAIVVTDPQVASVGLTESAARAAGHRVRVSTIGLDQVLRASLLATTAGSSSSWPTPIPAVAWCAHPSARRRRQHPNRDPCDPSELHRQ